MSDTSFRVNEKGLRRALQSLTSMELHQSSVDDLPICLPETGLDEDQVIADLAPLVLGGARHLGNETAFAHMDPPTPWITWAMALWNAALNQNLLHPDVAPVARDIEARVVSWLCPFFAMSGGHMTPGSTVSNLTALWAARELGGARRVVASKEAHLSIGKAAHLLGMAFESIDCDASGHLDIRQLPGELTETAVVLTAGTTGSGAIDDLSAQIDAAWVHVDAAWAGPLRLSEVYRSRLDGIDNADSVSISAHKWLFQPKESGLVLFKDAENAHGAVSFGADYLAVPNVGLLGSHGANAVPLLASLLSWGRVGLAERIERSMSLADELKQFLDRQDRVIVFGPNTSGVLLWRVDGLPDARTIVDQMPSGAASTTRLAGQEWVRHVAANPNAAIPKLTVAIQQALANLV